MTKKDIIEVIAEECRFARKDVDIILRQFFETIRQQCLDLEIGESFNLVGFGTFKATKRNAKYTTHPATGEKVPVKAAKKINFTPARCYGIQKLDGEE